MNVVGDLSMQTHKGKNENVSVLPLLEKPQRFVVYIVTLLLEFVQRRPMYLFYHVRCAGVSADYMLLSPTKKKSA